MTIDWWTLGLQTINVLVLVWLLGHFFWRPVAAMIEQRRAAVQKTLADAEAKRAQATAALADIERTRTGFAREREAILKAAQENAEQARNARLTDTAKEAAALEDAAKTRIAKEQEDAEKAWTARSSHLAVDIARRLAGRLDGPSVRTAFLGWLLKEIGRLPDATRQAATEDGILLQAVSATPLEVSEQEHCRQAIADAFGAKPQITFTADPTLIAGLELHGPDFIVANSWRADLNQILTDLAHDNRS
ncbi:ATP synthase F0 subunit B [Bradyrhizobium canariense]|uniref:ATP synthase subunit b n=1 Tax=Bradyrhizobium canariense TaxID=255045 RepID=A0A1H1SUE5_9BRAD|nr:ATP synthase F0 subunit B [Bradyrhizobium canariense]SDS51657.1 ATP synthase F0 subcomplex B subunit [Bradyrhizobium canariense]